MFVLTDKQKVAIEQITNFLNNPDPEDYLFTLEGIGGSGKTSSVIAALLPFTKSNKKKIIGAALSHSAKNILQQSLSPGNIRCYTIAQIINMIQYISDDGKLKFGVNKYSINNPLHDVDILVIDECSMVDDFIKAEILKKRLSKCKIIFLGDPFQLPPVNDGDKDSITFNYTRAKLHDPIRYTGPIADLGLRIRAEVDHIKTGMAGTNFLINSWMNELGYSCRTSIVDENGSGYIFLNSLDDAVRIATNEFLNNPQDPNCMRLLGYTNKVVKSLNEQIRHHLYSGLEDEHGNLPQIVPNELLICDGGYSYKGNNILTNNQVLRVNEVFSTTTQEDNNTYNIITPTFNPPIKFPTDCQWPVIPILDKEKSSEAFEERLSELKALAIADKTLWKQYYSFKDRLAWFDYNYSCTTHVSQGATFTDAIIVERDIMEVKKISNKVKLQSLYVACTRAKRRIYILNTKYKVDQRQLPEDLRKELGI